MINNNTFSNKDSHPLSREKAIELLRSMSKDKLLDQLHIDHFNNSVNTNGLQTR